MGRHKQKLINQKQMQDDDLDEESGELQDPSEQQALNDIQSLSGQQDQEQQYSESSPVVAAITTMKFRAKRGAKMKDLMKGKIEKDQFWEKNNVYFGGDLRGKDQDEHESDYQASSSGRDQFDSDFDLTDSYPGKRGRKKGQKVKRKIKRNGATRPRGRPKKIKEQSQSSENQKNQEQKIKQIKEKKKKIYKQIPSKAHDVFIIYKAIGQKKKQAKQSSKAVSKEQQDDSGSKQGSNSGSIQGQQI